MMAEAIYESDSVPHLKKRVEMYTNRICKLTAELDKSEAQVKALRANNDALARALKAMKADYWITYCRLPWANAGKVVKRFFDELITIKATDVALAEHQALSAKGEKGEDNGNTR